MSVGESGGDVGGASDVGSASSSAPASQASGASQSAGRPSPAQSSPAPHQQSRTVWDSFKDIDDFKGMSDVEIARSLYTSRERERAAAAKLAEYQRLVPVAQQYAQNREPFEQFLSQREEFQKFLQSKQQQAPQQQQPEKKKWWNPPEVREAYKQYIVKDENGRDIISPDAPLDAKHALTEWMKYRADFAQKFLSDPAAAIGPLVDERAEELARKIVEGKMTEASHQHFVSSLEQENADWLYTQTPDGQRVPTEAGMAVERYIGEAVQLGIADPQQRWNYAQMKLEHELMGKVIQMRKEAEQRGSFEQRLAPNPAEIPEEIDDLEGEEVDEEEENLPDPPQANAANRVTRDMDFLRREAARNPSRGVGSSGQPVEMPQMTFEQRLARQLARDNR